MMHFVALQVIPEPDLSRSTLMRQGEGTVIFDGDFAGPSYVCGACSAPLIEGVQGDHIIDLVLWCNACNSYNEAPSADTALLDGTSIETPVTFPPGRYEPSEPITVHERFVMMSSRAQRGQPLGTPVQYDA